MNRVSTTCRHCGRRATKPRRLCYRCYEDRAIRFAYPCSPHGSPGPGADRCGGYNDPKPEPTAARPGSPEKIATLSRRLFASQQLHHPDDGRLDDEPRPPLHAPAPEPFWVGLFGGRRRKKVAA